MLRIFSTYFQNRRERLTERQRAADILNTEDLNEQDWNDVFVTQSGIRKNIRRTAYPNEYVRPHAGYLGRKTKLSDTQF